MAVTYRCAPLSTMMGEHHCFCAKCGDKKSKDCEARLRLHEHCENITYIISECPEIVKVLVGPNEIEMTCQKAALGFYSDFFDAAFYGGMAEATEGVVRLPEESTIGIATFISWVYTGQIRSSVSAEELWIMGDRLRSPTFCNEVMHFMFGLYGTCPDFGGRWLNATSLDLIHEKTTENSKLMLLARDLLKAGGPLCPRALETEAKYHGDKSYEEDWHDLIKRGGDLVLKIVLEMSFYEDIYGDPDYDDDDDPDCVAPWKLSNQKKFMFPITERTSKEYVLGKKVSAPEMGRRK